MSNEKETIAKKHTGNCGTYCPKINDSCREDCAWYIEKQGCAVMVFAKTIHEALKVGNLLKAMLGRPDLLKKLKKVVKKREDKK